MMFLARVCGNRGVGDNHVGHADILPPSLAIKQKVEADFEKGKKHHLTCFLYTVHRQEKWLFTFAVQRVQRNLRVLFPKHIKLDVLNLGLSAILSFCNITFLNVAWKTC